MHTREFPVCLTEPVKTGTPITRKTSRESHQVTTLQQLTVLILLAAVVFHQLSEQRCPGSFGCNLSVRGLVEQEQVAVALKTTPSLREALLCRDIIRQCSPGQCDL